MEEKGIKEIIVFLHGYFTRDAAKITGTSAMESQY